MGKHRDPRDDDSFETVQREHKSVQELLDQNPQLLRPMPSRLKRQIATDHLHQMVVPPPLPPKED